MKLKVGVIFGGKSLEHEMSIITALQAMDNIDTDKYEIMYSMLCHRRCVDCARVLDDCVLH